MANGSDAQHVDIVVVGGGLAGLVAAATAARRGARVVVLDAHLGGRARCDERDGFVFNRGPRALYLGGDARPVLDALGVDTTSGGPPQLRGASASLGGTLHRLPDGARTLLTTSLLTAGEKRRSAALLATLARIDATTLAGTTVASWLDGTGVHGTARALVEALVRLSTYIHAPDLFDAGAAVRYLQLATGAGVRYLDGGWQPIVDALAAAPGVELRPVAAQAIEVADRGGGPLRVRTAAGDLTASTVILAVGTPSAAAALLGRADPWPTLGPPATAACLELGLRAAPIRRFVLGIDTPTYLSTHCPPARLAPAGAAVVHLLRYHRPGAGSDAEADRQVLEAATERAGITPDDIVTRRFLARMVVTGGVPTAAGGGFAGRPAMAGPDRPGILLAGDWVGPVGLLADAAVASGAAAGAHAAARSTTIMAS